MLERFLFETRLGEWLLAQFEHRTGLAIIRSESLGNQEIWPRIETSGQNGKQDAASDELEAQLLGVKGG